MSEIASEHNTTTFIPIPLDLFTPFMKKSGEEPTKNEFRRPTPVNENQFFATGLC